MPENDIQPWKKDVSDIMEEQHRFQIVHEQRLTQVEQQIHTQETRVTVIEANQGRLEMTMNKLAETVTVQVKQTTLNEAAIAVMKDGLVLHSKNIEDMKTEQVASGRLLERMETQIGFMKTFGGASLAIGIGIIISIIGVFVSHYIRF